MITEVSSRMSKLPSSRIQQDTTSSTSSELYSDETAEFQQFQIGPEGHIVMRRLDVHWKMVSIVQNRGIGGYHSSNGSGDSNADGSSFIGSIF
jgi:hypothetical protein